MACSSSPGIGISLHATWPRASLRNFRVGRISAVNVSASRAGTPDYDIAAGFVRYSPTIARWIAEREGVKLAADGSVTLEHPVADEGWAIRHVLQYGPDAELFDPPELRALLARRLGEMLETTIP